MTRSGLKFTSRSGCAGRTRWWWPALLIGLGNWSDPAGAQNRSAVRPPNIVLIVADDMGSGDLSCYGGKRAKTPNLDRLASAGTRFTQYYTGAPICSPSRVALLTGQYPGRWRITSFLQTRDGNRACQQVDFLDPGAPTLPRTLRAGGYATAHFGKWHAGGGRDVTDAPKFAAYGIDEHAGTHESPEPHPDLTKGSWLFSSGDKIKRWERSAFFVEKALDFLRRSQARHQPSYVNVWLDDPHTPWVPSPKASTGETSENLRDVLVELDQQVGRLVDGIHRLGLGDDTLILFTSDNGPLPPLGDTRTAGLRGSKLSLYEGGIRVPLIAVWPGHVPAGRVDTQSVVAAVDLAPTLAALAGVKVADGVATDGENRAEVLVPGHPVDRSKPLFWEYGRNETAFRYPENPANRSPQLAIRDGRWKCLANADGSAIELYDLAANPTETTDLAARHPAIARSLADKLLRWRQSLP